MDTPQILKNFRKRCYNPLQFCEILGNNEKSLDTDIYYSQHAKIIAYGGPKINFPKGTNFWETPNTLFGRSRCVRFASKVEIRKKVQFKEDTRKDFILHQSSITNEYYTILLLVKIVEIVFWPQMHHFT